jgi:hypothetical protein
LYASINGYGNPDEVAVTASTRLHNQPENAALAQEYSSIENQ